MADDLQNQLLINGCGIMALMFMEEDEVMAMMGMRRMHRFWVRPWLRRRGQNANTIYTLMEEICNVSYHPIFDILMLTPNCLT